MSSRLRKSPMGAPRGIGRPRTDKPAGWGRRGDRAGYAIRLTLEGSDPPVWRDLEVPGALSLHLFHLVIQIVMPWENEHLHEFKIGEDRWGVVGPAGYRPGMGIRDEREATLADLIGGPGLIFSYVYDWGDLWQHTLTVRDVLPPGRCPDRPRCLGGSGLPPPEDCGGMEGYQKLLEALGDPRNPDHRQARQVLGDDFDPEHFNPLVADEMLRRPPSPSALEPAGLNPAELFNYLLHRAIEEESDNLRSKRDFNRVLTKQQRRFAEMPDPDLGGLSPNQYGRLKASDWGRPGSALQFVTDHIQAADLAGVTAWEHAIGLLALLAERGGSVPFSGGQAFEPALIEEVTARPAWSQWLAENQIRLPDGDVSDPDHPVNQLGRMLAGCGLLKIRRGRIGLTPRGRPRSAPGRAGELLADLFRAVFARPAGATLQGREVDATLRAQAAYALWRFSVLPRQWYSLGTVGLEALPLTVSNRIADIWEHIFAQDPETEHMSLLPAVMISFDQCVLAPLSDFGLLERRVTGGDIRAYTVHDYRRTPLMERFIRFEGLPTEPFLLKDWIER